MKDFPSLRSQHDHHLEHLPTAMDPASNQNAHARPQMNDMGGQVRPGHASLALRPIGSQSTTPSGRLPSQAGSMPWGWPSGVPTSHAPATPVPVRQRQIPGTPWVEVSTNTGATYWHNKETKESTWTKPADIRPAPAPPPPPKPLDPMKKKMLERAKASGAILAPQYAHLAIEAGSGRGGFDAIAPSAEDLRMPEEDDVTFTEEDIQPDRALAPPASKKRVPPPPEWRDSKPPMGKAQKKLRPAGLEGLGEMQEVEPAVARDFKTLLSEHGIHEFSRYEREVAKIGQDGRFQRVPSHLRRPLFEEYCIGCGKAKAGAGGRDRGEATQNASSAQRHEENEKEFKNMLMERISDADVSWREAQNLLRSDPRFAAIENPSRRESIFRTHIGRLRRVDDARRQAEERAARELSAAMRRQHTAMEIEAKQSYQTLLTEMVRDPNASWDSAKLKLESDALGRGRHPTLNEDDMRKMFEAHIRSLKEKHSSAEAQE